MGTYNDKEKNQSTKTLNRPGINMPSLEIPLRTPPV